MTPMGRPEVGKLINVRLGGGTTRPGRRICRGVRNQAGRGDSAARRNGADPTQGCRCQALHPARRAEYAPGQQIRVWDIDGKGQPHECEFLTTSTGYDEDDWAHVDVRVVRKGTKELVVSTGYRVDGRA
jgi:hypothetical protein